MYPLTFPVATRSFLGDTILGVFRTQSTGLSVALELILGVLALSVLRFFKNTLEQISLTKHEAAAFALAAPSLVYYNARVRILPGAQSTVLARISKATSIFGPE